MSQLGPWDYSEADFCATEPTLSRRTLDRIEKEYANQAPIATADLIARKLNYSNRRQMIDEWDRAFTATAVRPLDSASNLDAEREFSSLKKSGLHDKAARVALHALARAELTSDLQLIAHWNDRVADAYRASGLLDDATAYYDRAAGVATQALINNPHSIELRVQIGMTKFGQTVVDSYMRRSAFREALARHVELQSELDAIVSDIGPDPQDATDAKIRRALLERRPHLERQQAEMLRYLGHYGQARELILAAASHYSAGAWEEHWYTQLSEADITRQLGNASAALRMYFALEQVARDRDAPAQLGSVLWRKACATEQAGNHALKSESLKEVTKIAHGGIGRFRYMVVYALLCQSAGYVSLRDAPAALRRLEKAVELGPLTPSSFAVEFAHAALCRGELYRTMRSRAEALKWFNKASLLYRRMDCRWGIVRSYLGRSSVGGTMDAMDPRFVATLEGDDAAMLRNLASTARISAGLLSANLP